MIRKKKHVLYWLVSLLMLPSFIQAASAESSTPSKKILITPIWLNSAEDLSFLNRGIMEMLTTRLPAQGGIAVVQSTKAPQDNADAVAMALKKKADYVLIGGATIFGGRVSTDLRLIAVPDSRIVLSFSRFGKEPGDILGHIDELAPEIIARIAPGSGSTQQPAPPQPPPAAALPSPAAAKPVSRVAPEPPEIAKTAQTTIWKGAATDFEVVSLVSADVTGNGRPYLVAAGNHSVVLYRMDLPSGTFSPSARWEAPAHQTILRIDAADPGDNKKAELYATIIDKNQRLSSAVLVYDKEKLVPIMQSLAWFFHASQIPGEPERVFGQKQQVIGRDSSFEIADQTPFLPGIFELYRNGRSLKTRARIDAPSDVTIFDFSLGAVLDTGNRNLITFDRRDRLQVFSADGHKRLWRSSEPFGGSETYMSIPSDMGTDRSGRFYLPQRILLTNADRNGRRDMIVVRNHGIAKRLFERYRRYTRGEVVRLTWTGATFRERQIGDSLDGYLSDIALVTAAQNQPQHVVAALVSGGEGFLGKRNTRFVVQAIQAAD